MPNHQTGGYGESVRGVTADFEAKGPNGYSRIAYYLDPKSYTLDLLSKPHEVPQSRRLVKKLLPGLWTLPVGLFLGAEGLQIEALGNRISFRS